MRIESRNKNCPKEISFRYLNEEQAQRNHMQSLDRLNQRGGMSAVEVVANIERKSFSKLNHDIYDDEYYVMKLCEYLKNTNK